MDNATNSGVNCTEGPFALDSDDVWFKVVAPASGEIAFEWDNLDLIANVYSSSDGTCDNLSPISCGNFRGTVILTNVRVFDNSCNPIITK